jgi:hypothetical protein
LIVANDNVTLPTFAVYFLSNAEMTGVLVAARAPLSKMHNQSIAPTVFAKEPSTQFMTRMWIFAVIFGTLGCHIKYVITIVTYTVVVVDSAYH